MEQADLNVCRSVRYTKGWRKGAVRCTQCGFWFVPDSQKYPLADSEPMEYLTGVQWFEQFKCCPNCLPPEPTAPLDKRAPFGKRRCIGFQYSNTAWQRDKRNKLVSKTILRWSKRRACGIFTIRTSKTSHPVFCSRCKHVAKNREYTRADIIDTGRQLYRKLRRSFRITDWENAQLRPCSQLVISRFGSWQTFLEMMDLPQLSQEEQHRLRKKPVYYGSMPWFLHRSNVSDKEIIKSMQERYSQFGHALSINEWTRCRFTPSASLIVARFGWNKAWQLVGATPNKSIRDMTDGERAAVLELSRQARNICPTSREFWQVDHNLASPETVQKVTRYRAKQRHYAMKLDEQERIFKEHQFKSQESIDADSDS